MKNYYEHISSKNKFDFLNNKWLYIVILAILFIPPYMEAKYDMRILEQGLKEVIKTPIIYELPTFYGVLKIFSIIVFMTFILNKDKNHSIFNHYVVMLLVITSLFQTSTGSSSPRFVFLINIFLLNFIVTLCWIFQSIFFQENKIKNEIGNNKYWIIVLALIAFCFPVNKSMSVISFNIKSFFVNQSMVTFSCIIPVILALTIIFAHRINMITILITSYIGVIIGAFNIIIWFFMNDNFIMAVMNMPIFLISLYVFILSRRILSNQLKTYKN